MENNKIQIGNYRWVIVTLLLFSTTINYMDRQVISYLKPFFCSSAESGGFGWSNTDFSTLTSAFLLVYAFVSVFVGWFIDKIGIKIGLAISLIVWSIFGMVNALAGSTVAINVLIRSAFAVGEAGVFPVSIKTVAQWFPKKERALATGIFNSGTNMGAMVAALFVPWCMTYFGNDLGWKMSFILTGGVGFFFLIFWFWLYEIPSKQKRLSKTEFDYIHSDDIQEPAAQQKETVAQPIVVEDKASIPWFRLFRYKQTWSFFFGKFLTDGVWWFYLFWLPDYLIKQFGMTTLEVRWPTFIVFGVAIAGSVFGGSIPLFLINKGLPVYKARMRAMLMIAVVPLVVLSTQYFGNVSRFGTTAMYLAVTVICLAAAAHQAWSANLFTTVSDMFPKKAIASVTGIGTMAGGIGGVIIQKTSGYLNDVFVKTPQTAYLIMFIICAFGYLIAWFIIKGLVPRHKPITDL
jgi:ACS family hexuronate transporter-like MFS transporter